MHCGWVERMVDRLPGDQWPALVISCRECICAGEKIAEAVRRLVLSWDHMKGGLEDTIVLEERAESKTGLIVVAEDDWVS